MIKKAVAAAALVLVLAGSSWGQGTEKPAVPGAPQLAVLIQTAVVALAHANVTNNYTVLHAMASPAFQKANPPEKVSQIFAKVRRIDLTPVIIFSPVLSKPPVIDEKNMLRLTGHYETSPQRVLFDLLFQPVEGHWRLFGVSIATEPAPAAEKKTEKTGAKKDTKKEPKKDAKKDEKAKK